MKKISLIVIALFAIQSVYSQTKDNLNEQLKQQKEITKGETGNDDSNDMLASAGSFQGCDCHGDDENGNPTINISEYVRNAKIGDMTYNILIDCSEEDCEFRTCKYEQMQLVPYFDNNGLKRFRVDFVTKVGYCLPVYK